MSAPQTKKSSNRPQEISASRPVSRIRQVVELPGKKTRDPRFDHFCGKFNEDLFKKSYEFVNEYKTKELSELKEKLGKTKDANLRNELKATYTSEVSKIDSEKRKDARAALKRKIKKEEMELIKQGKKPYYLKKSAVRQIELTEKFNEYKDKKNFDKVLEKRRKRNATKEHKMLPFKRRQA